MKGDFTTVLCSQTVYLLNGQSQSIISKAIKAICTDLDISYLVLQTSLIINQQVHQIALEQALLKVEIFKAYFP